MVERQLEGVAHVVADHRGRAAERADEADLDAPLLRRRRHRREQDKRGGGKEKPLHVDSSHKIGRFAGDLKGSFRASKAPVCQAKSADWRASPALGLCRRAAYKLRHLPWMAAAAHERSASCTI